MTPRNGRVEQLGGANLAVVGNRFEGVVRAMMNTLLRTARSSILNTARDFSCCVLTADHRILAMADSLPIHVMSGPDRMAEFMGESHPVLRRGDAFLHNSPYHGNSHAADWCILVPVVDDDGVHRATVLAKAHLADCGNSVPTSYVATARDVYEEGALIFPCVKIQENYQDREDVLRMARVRIRVPEVWHGDYLALLGAARIGERRLLGLIAESGPELLDRYADAWFDYSERRMAAAIERLPAGVVSASAHHDPIPGIPDGITVNASVDVRPGEGRIVVDLRDNVDCQPCGLNLTEATSRTAAMVGVFTALGTDVPPNAGSFRRLEVLLRENCAVGIPRHPASCSVATTNLSEHVANCVTKAMAQLADGIGTAEFGRMQPPAMGVVSGRDPRTGEPFINQLMLATTGGAATPVEDGWLTYVGIGGAGALLRDSVELDELKYPLFIHEQRIIPDSEGAGRFRGAPGAYVEFGPLGGAIEVMYMSDGVLNAAQGVRGGGEGSRAVQRLRARDGSLSEEIGNYARVTLNPGERIVSHTCGGGGYGPPSERQPERVAHDVREGWVTPERARDVYRVALTADGDVDEEGTARLRGAT